MHSPLRVLITGGTGFIGKRLARQLLAQPMLTLEGEAPRKIDKIILLDTFPADDLPTDPRLEVRIGEIDDSVLLDELTREVDLVWHLAAVVSSAAEADFELGMQVNLHGLLALLEAMRAQPKPARLVYASGFAIFGGPLPEVVGDGTLPTPVSSYGIQKAIGEMLINDYSRRGFVDGRTLRLPTIAVRPGKPNKAASTFVSSIIREPLVGERAICPVTPETPVYITSPRRVLDAMLHAMALDAERLGQSRTIPLPGLTVTIAQMVAALERVAGRAASQLIEWREDAEIQRIVASWPSRVEAPRAAELGFHADGDIESIIRAHVEDEGITVTGDRP